MAIASMVLGIVWIYGITSVLALILGYQAKREIARTGKRGEEMATAGLVLGWVALMGLVLFIMFFVVLVNHVQFPSKT